MKDRRKNELKIGAFFLTGALAILMVLEFAGSLPLFSNYRDVDIYFDSAPGLEEGAFVKMEGVRIGNVRRIGFSDGRDRIKVRIGLEKDIVLRENTVASIRLSSLLGTNYINLSLADLSSPPLPHGASLNGRTPHDFDRILQDAGEFMSMASKAAVRLNSILEKVDEGEGFVGKLVNEEELYHSAKDVLLKAQTSLDTIEDLAPVSFIATVLGVAGTFY